MSASTWRAYAIWSQVVIFFLGLQLLLEDVFEHGASGAIVLDAAIVVSAVLAVIDWVRS